MLLGLHYEDIKASIRKKYRTISAFETAHGLPLKSVNKLTRGHKSSRVLDAIRQHAAESGLMPKGEHSPSTKAAKSAHRLNRQAA